MSIGLATGKDLTGERRGKNGCHQVWSGDEGGGGVDETVTGRMIGAEM